MENIWDYVMRRKPVFLGYFALFLVSIFASCQFLGNIVPKLANPDITQESPETPQTQNEPQYYDRVLSPQAVAALSEGSVIQTSPAETTFPDHSDNSLAFVQVEIASPVNPTSPTDLYQPTNDSKTTLQQPVEVPLTGAPVSIFRTILAVLLAVAALTLAGLGLYQAYDYFRPFFKS